MRKRPASLSASLRRCPNGILRASAITSVARSSHERLSACCSGRLTPECICLYHQFTNVIALEAFERAEVETDAHGHGAGEHHVIAALGADRTLDLDVNVVRQGMRFWHDASLKVWEQNTLSHRYVPVKKIAGIEQP
jgi:hypothetical protein